MIISEQEQNIVIQDSVRKLSDSLDRQERISADTIKTVDSAQAGTEATPRITEILKVTDTTSVCTRNSISDVTFYDSNNLVYRIDVRSSNSFPFLFIEKNIGNKLDERISLMKHLREGKELPVRPFNEDWIILIFLFAALIFSVARTFSKKLFPDAVKFFLFRGIGDTSFRDLGILFQLQSTLLNLISFINMALFGYYAAFFYNVNPPGISGFLFWLISFGVIIVLITLRHFICVITGIVTGQRETFNEYLLNVYLFYRFTALIMSVLVILMTFTVFSPSKFFFITGFSAMALLYIIRIIRLLLIFLARNISIFYFILYLCGLEILPVMIFLKYLTGHFLGWQVVL
ncbi:MAG: DUF4271 domain-containing protein [Bacteroidales bacterium]|nr:DUF4271 domain-containing protein [Bacteroidales bacterium]